MSPSLPSRVTVREVGPRDGLQAEQPLPIQQRAGLIDMLGGANLPKIEALAFVSPRAVPAMADAAEMWRLVRRREDVTYSALVPNRRGADAAVEAGGFSSLQAFVAASEGYSQANVGKSVSESLQDVRDVIEVGRGEGIPVEVSVSCAFGDPYQGEIPPDAVLSVTERVAEAGAVGVSLGDTSGMATPRTVWELVPPVRDRFPDLRLNLHFHDTRGGAMANVLAAMEVGVDEFDASIGGMGGSPFAPGAGGNVPTDDLVAMLMSMGIETGVDVLALFTATRMLQGMIGHPLPGSAWRADYPELGWTAPVTHEEWNTSAGEAER
jgi:hydroxymethylglutaryl-CoA lyase